MVFYLLLRFASFVIRHLPKRWGLALARLAGRLIYRVSPFAEDGRDNFRHVLHPDADPERVDALAREAFEVRVINYLDMFRLSNMSLEELGWRTEYNGFEHVERLREDPQGFLAVTAHYGPTEFLAQSAAALGLPLMVLVEQMPNQRVHDYIKALRTAHGLELVATDSSMLDVYRRLKRGDILIAAVDRDATETGIVVDFLGQPAWVPDGYARLAVRANIPIIVGFCQRTDKGAKVTFSPPIYPDQSLGRQQATRDIVNRTLGLFEEVVRRDPGAWHLSTPVWRLAEERIKHGAVN